MRPVASSTIDGTPMPIAAVSSLRRLSTTATTSSRSALRTPWLVPAMTGPAMASSSRSLPPELWLTAKRREAAMMPPTAAIAEQSAKTTTRTRLTLMPARRDASALPPTA